MMLIKGETAMKVYIDGKYFDKEEAKISVYDHGLLYGDGVFEGIRIYNGRVFKLREHIRRLYDSAHAIMLNIPLAEGEMITAVEETVSVNEKRDGYIRLLVTRGVGTLGLDPDKCPDPSVIIIVDDIALYPEELYKNGIAVVTAAQRRLPPDGIDPRIKSLNYLNNILAKIQAKQAGCLEAVMLNKEGYIAECTADNLFIVKDSCVSTPQSMYGALSGITRSVVFELCGRLQIPAEEKGLTLYDLYLADECFLTGSGAEIMPVTKADGRSIGSGRAGSVTEGLRAAFGEYIGG